MTNVSRRYFLAKAPATAALGALVSSGTVAIPAAAATSERADPELVGLEGLPLAAVHIQRAIEAMGDFHFGKWEVTIRSGEPDQVWCFRQISPRGVDPELRRLIAAHRAAWDAFGETCDAADETSEAYAGVAGKAAYEAASMAEERALARALLYPTRTPADRRAKGEHLRWVEEDCGGIDGYADAIIDSLLASEGDVQ